MLPPSLGPLERVCVCVFTLLSYLSYLTPALECLVCSPSMIYTPCNRVELVNPPGLPWIPYPLEYSFGEMLQWYFHALADSYNRYDYHLVISGIVARNP
jgi:hypothetical protein